MFYEAGDQVNNHEFKLRANKILILSIDDYQNQFIKHMSGCTLSVQRDQNVQNSNEIAIGNNQLTAKRQDQMQDRLHRHIVAIVWKSKRGDDGRGDDERGDEGRGSGLLISKNLVLTTAHNFYLNGHEINRKCFQIYISPCGTIKNPYKIQCVYIPHQYRESPQNSSTQYDYALVKLQEKVETDSFIFLKAFEQSQMANKKEMKIAIFGYPKVNYRIINGQQSVVQSGITKKDCIDSISVKRSQVLHLVSTDNGQSGSPMIQIKEEGLVVMGIHKGGITLNAHSNNEKKLNTGRLITQELIKNLQIQANVIGGQMFQIYDKLNPLKLTKIESKKSKERASQFFSKLDNQLQQETKQLSSQPQISQMLSIEQLMKRGDELYNNSQFKKSRQYYRKILQSRPYHSKAYFNMGLTFQGESNFESAILTYNRVTMIDPQNYQAYYNLGYCNQKKNNNKQAKRSYQSCLRINPSHQNSKKSLSNLK